jgi:hypothetical protein
MANHRLLLISIVLIGFGLIGIITTTFFHSGGWVPMVGQGMMGLNPMTEMMERMMPDLLPPGTSPENLPEPDSQGARLLVQYCIQCHNLPSPSLHTAGEWPGIARRMFRRMSMMFGMGMVMSIETPSPGEHQTIITYLESHAQK